VDEKKRHRSKDEKLTSLSACAFKRISSDVSGRDDAFSYRVEKV